MGLVEQTTRKKTKCLWAWGLGLLSTLPFKYICRTSHTICYAKYRLTTCTRSIFMDYTKFLGFDGLCGSITRICEQILPQRQHRCTSVSMRHLPHTQTHTAIIHHIISYHTVPESWIPLFAFLSLLWIRKWKSKRHISLSEKHSFYCHHRLTRIEWLTSMALGLSRLSLFFTVWHIFSYEFFSLASLILIEREKTVFSFLFSGRRCLCGTRYCVVADHNKKHSNHLRPIFLHTLHDSIFKNQKANETIYH